MKKRRKEKHGRPDKADAVVEFGVLSDRLGEAEKMFYARLKARQMYNETTKSNLPLEAFTVEKDAQGDYLVTIKTEEGNK